MKRAITADHALISSYIDGINQLWLKISPLPAAIQKDQAAVDLTLKVVAQQNQAMLKQALVIRQNGVVIGANLLAAAQKVEAIQLNAALIKEGHQAIGRENEQIEEKKSELQQKVQELKDLQTEGLNDDGIIKDEIITQEGTSGFWSTLVQKITAFASWFFSKIVGIPCCGRGRDQTMACRLPYPFAFRCDQPPGVMGHFRGGCLCCHQKHDFFNCLHWIGMFAFLLSVEQPKSDLN